MVADATAMGLSVLLATALRYDFAIPDRKYPEVIWFAVGAALVFAVCGAARGLYAGRWSFGTFEEVSALVSAIFVATAILWAIALALPKELSERPIPLSVPVIASTIMLATSAGVRIGPTGATAGSSRTIRAGAIIAADRTTAGSAPVITTARAIGSAVRTPTG